jgi:predicted dehydrogenase
LWSLTSDGTPRTPCQRQRRATCILAVGVGERKCVQVSVGLGILGCGSVFEAYARQIKGMEAEGRAEILVAYDPVEERRRIAQELFPAARTSVKTAEAVLDDPAVQAVCVLTSMNEHASLAIAALTAGKHVLVEKPMATSLAEAALLTQTARQSEGVLVCAPHVLLSPTYRQLYDRVREEDIGRVLSARARYGWRGPEWAEWYYKPGGGAIFDLGIYNIVSLCGLLGPVRRVAAMVGTAVPSRTVRNRDVAVEVEDSAHLLLDFGDSRFAVVTTGFVITNYRSPAIELYGERGVLQLMGDDWAPNGLERWHDSHDVWEIHRETAPSWPWTDGIRHLVECIESGAKPVLRPEHAYHALEVAVAAKKASSEGRHQVITSTFQPLDYGAVERSVLGARFHHDPRNS